MLDVTYLLTDIDLTLDNSPVFQSQVLDWMRVQTECGVKIGLVTQIAEQQTFDDRIVQLLMELGVPFEPSTQLGRGGLPGQVVRSALALRRFAKVNPSRNIYVRGVWGAYSYLLAYPFGGPRLIYDFRGDVETEFSYRKRRHWKAWVLSRLVGRAIRAADITICTSKPAAKLLELRYGARPSTVIPSCVDTRRYYTNPSAIQAARSKLGYAHDDIVFVYSGGISRYQMIQEMIDIWATLQDDPKIKFLVPGKAWGIFGVRISCSNFTWNRGRIEYRYVPRTRSAGFSK